MALGVIGDGTRVRPADAARTPIARPRVTTVHDGQPTAASISGAGVAVFEPGVAMTVSA
jgi:hypothetical protein